MNIYQKIQKVKLELAQRELKKSGENTYSGFKYYELGDFLPSIIELCDKYKLFTQVSFTAEMGILNIVDTEEQDNQHNAITYTSPIKELELKGANAIQAMGGVQTYLRRYLYMAAFDIVEADMFDSKKFEKEKKKKEVKSELEELILSCKKEFSRLSKMKTDAKAKQEDREKAEATINAAGELMKNLGYSTFNDVSKKQEQNDVIALANILGVEVKNLEEK